MDLFVDALDDLEHKLDGVAGSGLLGEALLPPTVAKALGLKLQTSF